ncbi:dephospho-CoA kinase [soil metagenome]
MASGTFSVGMTGGIGCGKSTVADLFAARGATIVDTDHIAHQLTAPGGLAIPAIRSRFGSDFLTEAGAMDRTKMREHVFADPAARHQLEAVLHPLIRSETERATREAAGLYVMLVVPLMIESGGWKERVARLLVIDCPEQLQLSRVMRRSALTEAQVQAIMNTQVTRQARLAAADDIITNDADTAALLPQVDRLHQDYVRLAGEAGRKPR